MKLKTRLVIAFLVMILVPILLGTVMFLGLTRYQVRLIERRYDISGVTYSDLTNTLRLLDALNENVYEEVSGIASSDPDKLVQDDYLSQTEADLQEKFSFLVVRKNDTIVYDDSQSDTGIDTSALPAYGAGKLSNSAAFYLGGESQSIERQIDFTFSDGSTGSVFVFTRGVSIIPQTKHMLRDTLTMILLILCITAFTLSWWLNQYLIHPITKLTSAAKNIKEGNLDFTMQGTDSKDEIGELCVNFEEMRQRLKDQAEEKLRYDKENKELISNISHDLKTPLTAIKGYVEGIMDGVADTPEKMDRYIRTIYNKTSEMDRLINELTFYSKIDTNRVPYTFNIINAARYFDDCAEELKLELDSKNVKLEYENSVNPQVRIIADAEQLRRVISNIISNSIKYMEKENGIIQLRVKDVGDFIQVELEDNGKGIAQKDLPFIFDRFYRTDASRGSSKGGSGIGLSIVKKIVDDHGGKIWATSREGYGTTMSFVIRKYQEVPVK